ncbi:E3 ubiquitin-protein ligase RHF2A [Citrus sinensis]|uniref:E3 ubiquitin-protein ligase RHF2A n=2 Tax=Citrus sinensis TaxID=2711 RepID=A0ACB8IQU2_CITSI|nr:E3 ubiquitin-protein ligase RHF2A [Citrus sinensis]
MEENKQSDDAHLTSAAAFVEGGIQDACDDACSICLEDFSESDPSTLTSCKHEFHLQCILEWCQRSSQCPMCWQPISLKDPTRFISHFLPFILFVAFYSCVQCKFKHFSYFCSQELLEAVERERSFRLNPSRNATIFRHPTLGDFELQHLPVGANDAELEERIIQHLAAAAAMGRARHIARRESHRNRASSQARPQFLVFSTHPNAANDDPVSSSPTHLEGEASPITTVATPSSPATGGEESTQQSTHLLSAQADHVSASASGSSAFASGQVGNTLNNRRSPNQPSPNSQDRAGPSDFQSFSESLKSRFNAVSMRYKESISKSTRGWKERFFSRNNTMADLGTEVRREVNAGISTVSRMMERLETRDSNSNNTTSVSSSSNNSVPELNNQQKSETADTNRMNDTSVQASCAASSGSN